MAGTLAEYIDLLRDRRFIFFVVDRHK
jgi:hypothetical protein